VRWKEASEEEMIIRKKKEQTWNTNIRKGRKIKKKRFEGEPFAR